MAEPLPRDYDLRLFRLRMRLRREHPEHARAHVDNIFDCAPDPYIGGADADGTPNRHHGSDRPAPRDTRPLRPPNPPLSMSSVHDCEHCLPADLPLETGPRGGVVAAHVDRTDPAGDVNDDRDTGMVHRGGGGGTRPRRPGADREAVTVTPPLYDPAHDTPSSERLAGLVPGVRFDPSPDGGVSSRG